MATPSLCRSVVASLLLTFALTGCGGVSDGDGVAGDAGGDDAGDSDGMAMDAGDDSGRGDVGGDATAEDVVVDASGSDVGVDAGGGDAGVDEGTDAGNDASSCVRKTCANAVPGGANCGLIDDGCGGTIDCTMASPACPAGQICGGGTPNVCGPKSCTPKTVADCGTSCGFIDTGCGDVVNCGAVNPCASPALCGAVTPGVCGAACVPKTCVQLGANCGVVGDGCGNLICCAPGGGSPDACSNACPDGQVCGERRPDVCGSEVKGSSACAPGVDTTITGKVVAATDAVAGFGNPDPIFNATVFVPKNALQPIAAGANCNQCANRESEIVSAKTGVDGTFTIVNPPTGPNVTVVIQLGKWRRVLTLNVTPCVDNALTTAQTRLPRKQSEFSALDNIPRLAVSTGNVDTMECVLRKMGIADTEFVAGDTGSGVPAAGRVHVYKASSGAVNGASGAVVNSAIATPADDKLWNSATALNAYDAVLFPCTGGQDNKTATAQANLVNYANAGGRVFATHNSYVWLYNNTSLGTVPPIASATWNSTATWNVDSGSYSGPNNGLIDTSFPTGLHLSEWLGQVVPPAPTVATAAMNATQLTVTVAATTGFPSAGTLIIDAEQMTYSSISATQFRGLVRGVNGTTAAAHSISAKVKLWAQIPVDVIRHDFDTPLSSSARRWMYLQNSAPGNGPGNFPIHYSFNTPAGGSATDQCGRVVFSDFHVENHAGSKNLVFPAECNGSTPMTPQEKLLEFMLFDLTSCVGPDVPICTPKTCADLGAQPYVCGQWGDGCGKPLNCGSCAAGTACGGGGVDGQCGSPCVPKTCAGIGAVCGSISDGCSSGITCTCPTGQSCANGACVAS